MSDCKYMHTNKHGKTTNGIHKGSTCKETCSPMDEWKMHVKRCAHQLMNIRTCTFTKRWACQAFQHESKEKRAKDSSSEPKTIKDTAHFAMRRWSYDTPWRHPSPNSIIAQHALQQQHKCTSTVMSSHVTHISTMGYVFNQCNVTWKSKRPTCWQNSHVSRKVMEVKWSWG